MTIVLGSSKTLSLISNGVRLLEKDIGMLWYWAILLYPQVIDSVIGGLALRHFTIHAHCGASL